MRLPTHQCRRPGPGRAGRDSQLLPEPNTLIAEAVKAAQAQQDSEQDTHAAELAAVQADPTKTTTAIDRYLDAFENSKLDADQLAERVGKLNERHKRLRWRRDELRLQLDSQPTMPDKATLTEVSRHITEIISSGNNNQRKAVIEALVSHIQVTGPDRIVPVFRIPSPNMTKGPKPIYRSRPLRFAQ